MTIHLIQVDVPDDVGVSCDELRPGLALVLGIVEVEHAGRSNGFPSPR